MTRRRNESLGRAKCRGLKFRGPSATVGGVTLGNILVGSATWDAANLVDGAGESKDVTVTGASLGDFAVASLGVDVQGITLTAAVKSSNTVTVRLQNETTGAIDLASTTVKVLVIKAITGL